MKKIPVIAIVGPTALGKSNLAVLVAKKIGGEVVSADSRQVYKGLNIGTGKITKKEMLGVPHHMLDIANPKKRISVVEFTRLATKKISEISRRGNVPIICGGTGFYIDELLFPSNIPEVKANKKLRAKLAKVSVEKLFLRLKKMDNRRSKEIDPKNKVRIIRALEIIDALGKVPKRTQGKSPYDVLVIELDAPLDFIRSNIKKRLVKRMSQGLLAEGKKLIKSGLSYKQLEAFGLEYKWLAKFLQKQITKKTFINGLENDIYQYARRQRTWFKKH
ncbi:MAG: tRNA (adenosine(37)-N6)-dimethylallyltransferase MiaA [Minisyncoccia bacterium]